MFSQPNPQIDSHMKCGYDVGMSPDVLPDPADIKRINVAVSPASLADIQHVMTTERINLTEAVRRLLGYGGFVYRAIKDDGHEVKLHRDSEVQTVVLLNG
jgi:hypothetical protein